MKTVSFGCAIVEETLTVAIHAKTQLRASEEVLITFRQ